MQKGQDIGHSVEIKQTQTKVGDHYSEDFVLEKSIFNNVFEKDIRRIFIYKKAERLAKAIHLIAPAFAESVSLRNRIDAIAIGLIDAAILSQGAAPLPIVLVAHVGKRGDGAGGKAIDAQRLLGRLLGLVVRLRG